LNTADGLLFVYPDPGPVPADEFHDWYDNEHGPARLTVPGISAGHRFRALDDQAPRWLAYYETKAGVLDTPEYTEEHIPMLLAVPGWRRIRRFRLTGGTAPAYLSLHEMSGTSVFGEDSYRAAVSTPWMKRIVGSAIGRERRLWGLHRSFGDV
jgi:hypothetical protein